jgi:hypothetical protein
MSSNIQLSCFKTKKTECSRIDREKERSFCFKIYFFCSKLLQQNFKHFRNFIYLKIKHYDLCSIVLVDREFFWRGISGVRRSFLGPLNHCLTSLISDSQKVQDLIVCGAVVSSQNVFFLKKFLQHEFWLKINFAACLTASDLCFF